MKLFHNKKFLITFFTVATLAIVIGTVAAIKIQLDKASANKAVAQMPEKKQEKIEALDIPEDDDSFLSLEDLESLEEEEEEPVEAEEVKVATKNEKKLNIEATMVNTSDIFSKYIISIFLPTSLIAYLKPQ